MKWYFAARMRHQSMLCDVAEKLQQQKEEILSSWLWRDSLKPYADHKEAAAAAAAQEVQEICDSNIFVLMSDQEGTDMFVELGVAFAVQKFINPKMEIYIVGEHNTRSLMHLYPTVQHVSTLEEVFERESIPAN